MILDPSFDDADWQARWDRTHRRYMPRRAAAVGAMLELLAQLDRPMRVLDLAGGPGPVSLAIAERIAGTHVTLADVDPVLLDIASATIRRRSLDGRIATVVVDLSTPGWAQAVDGPFDAVVVVMALHWFGASELRRIYDDLHHLVQPGGVFVNVDRIPATTTASTSGPSAPDEPGETWAQWWDALRRDPTLGDRFAARDERMAILPPSAEFHPDADWHLDALSSAGFDHVGELWRDDDDAAIVARRPLGGR